MSNDSESRSTEQAPVAMQVPHACFDGPFFANFLGNRARSLCEGKPDRTPVVLLHLADGAVLDLCHIEQLFPEWVAASVYFDPRSCERMDVVFVPYSLISRVTIALPPAAERRIGFHTESSPEPSTNGELAPK